MISIDSPPRRVFAFLALVIVALTGTAGNSEAQRAMAARPNAPQVDAWQPAPGAPGTVDGRPGLPVLIQTGVLRQMAATGGTLAITLPGGLRVRASIAWAQGGDGQSFVAGPLVDADGEISLTLVGDTVFGRIVAGDHLFVVRRLPNSAAHVVTELDPRALPPEASPLVVPPTGADRAQPGDQSAVDTGADTNAYVDLMILYTPAARTQIGGTSPMIAELTAALNNANLALANSGVAHRFRLVHYEEVAYSETGALGTSLDRLTFGGDGYLDNVPALRDLYHADVVTLLTADTDACGLAWIMGSGNVSALFEPYAYNVVAWNCANANLSLAHEIGHNMGLDHDRVNASSTPSFPYAYGYSVPGVARDVMAYPCPVSCPRRAIYSTPLFNFPGTAVIAGTAREDTARALSNTSLIVANFRQQAIHQNPPADFDGDSRTDVAVFRPSTGIWYVRQSGSGAGAFLQWGITGDVPAAGDYDGDGKADVAVFRPSTGIWYVRNAVNGTASFYQWGLSGDIPVPMDYDGDGKTDIAVWRPSTGIWYIRNSSTGGQAFLQWGLTGDVPAPGDYDGDGKADAAVFQPSTGLWSVRDLATNTPIFFQLGLNGDIPVAADYDGDGKTDVAVWRPSTGIWDIRQSSNGASASLQWGLTGDLPVPDDYDGDGKTDSAVFRPSTGIWYVRNLMTNTTLFYQWGLSGDIPIH